ncbi:diguanylate cyclase [Magnetospirillum aberrantis]
MVLIAALLAMVMAWATVPAQAAGLTEAERAYVASHGPFTYCVDPDWPPYEVITPQGEHQGIAGDLLRLAAERAGIQLTLLPTKDWSDSIAASQDGRCQFLSFLNKSPKREEWLSFTRPLFTDRNVIVTREDHPYIDDLAHETGKVMVLPRGTFIEEMVRRDFPGLKLVTTNSEAEAFFMVSNKQADMTVRSMIVAVYTIKKDGWFNLKVSGEIPGYENNLRIGVRKDMALLRDILDKGVADISPSERNAIANRHVSISVQYGVDYGLIAKIVGAFMIALLTSLFWLSRLRGMNRKLLALSLTDPLTLLANRACLNQRLEQECQRARRHGTAFSAILFDLDHFKRINDELGHLTGDTVLVQFAAIARATVRTQDVVGRWGGEEFLVLCPETNLEQAAILAERLCRAVREHDFQTTRRHTVSAGVAELSESDTVDSLLNRTDQALYQAKNGGRDRVQARAATDRQ